MTREQKVRALIPYFQTNNPGRTVDEITSFARQMTDQELDNTYNHCAPLDQNTEALIAAQADLHVTVDNRRTQQNIQHKEQARAQFADIARQLGIANNDANFNLAYGSLRPNTFNAEDISQFIADGRLSFIPASPDELAETDLLEKQKIVDEVWNSLRGHIVKKIIGGSGPNDFDVFGQVTYGESKEQNRQRQIRRLLELPLDRLRQLHQQAEDNRAVKSGQVVNRPPAVDPNLNSGSGLDRANGGSYVPLPHKNAHGETLDAAYLVKLANRDINLYKRLLRKHGYFNMTQRIKGIA
jgi:hypothetical protein